MGGVPTPRRGAGIVAVLLAATFATAAPAWAETPKNPLVRARTTVPAPRTDIPDLSRSPFDPDRASLEEGLVQQLRDVWAGRNLRRGTTAVYVVDAHSGTPLFAVNEDRALNPASNVKLVSTATALHVLGPDWRYVTQLLGPQPDAEGVIRGDLYLLGNADPTFRERHLDELAAALAADGITRVEGALVSSNDELRDAVGRARIKVRVVGTDAGKPPEVTVEPPLPFITVEVGARSTSRGRRPRLNVSTRLEEATDDSPQRLVVRVNGRIRAGRGAAYWRSVPDAPLFTLHALGHALTEAGIEVTQPPRYADLNAYVGQASYAGYLPVELARHESASVETLIAWVNKPSNNFLADRLIQTVGAVRYGGAPTMDKGVRAMNEWLASIGVDPEGLILDTGSGLSYQTEMTPRQIVRVIRAASGLVHEAPKAEPAAPPVERAGGGIDGSFAVGLDVPRATDDAEGKAQGFASFVESLAVAGRDGTLRRRFRGSPAADVCVGKTGTLTRVIALSGLVDLGDDEVVAFAIVTNGHRHRRRNVVRHEHERFVEHMLDYLRARKALRDAGPDDAGPDDSGTIGAEATAAPAP